MLAFIGDIHGEAKVLAGIVDKIAEYPDIKAIIQVGDFGFYPKLMPNFYHIKPPIPIYAIDGNHEHFPMLRGITEITEMATNIFFVPRGTVLELDGRKIGFCGGAASVDKQIRQEYGMSWYADENITDDDIAKFDDVTALDILVTHVPPQSVIQKNFSPDTLVKYFGLPRTWTDPSADKIEALWNRLDQPLLICGHMHKSVTDRTCRILNIAELFAI